MPMFVWSNRSALFTVSCGVVDEICWVLGVNDALECMVLYLASKKATASFMVFIFHWVIVIEREIYRCYSTVTYLS